MGLYDELLTKLGINDDSGDEELEPIDPTAPRNAEGRIPTLAEADREREYGPTISEGSKPAAMKPGYSMNEVTSPEDKAFWSKQHAGMTTDADLGSAMASSDKPAWTPDHGLQSKSRAASLTDADLGRIMSSSDKPAWKSDAPPDLSQRIVKGATGFRKSPDRTATKALVAKATGGVRLPDDEEPIPSAGGASLPAQVARMTMGAAPRSQGGPPPAPAPDNGDDELRRAQKAAKDAEREAQYAHGMGAASDMIAGGQRFNQRAGEDIRAAGQQGVKDVLARRDQGRQTEDQGFQRAGEARAVGDDQRKQKAFADNQEMDVPGTRKAKQWEILARAKQPRETQRITPEQGAGMSANDWKLFLDEKGEQIVRPAGTGGGGAAGGRNLAALGKLLPPETANIWAAKRRIDQLVEKGGGWGDAEGLGLAAGKVPAIFLGESGKALRQEIGGLTGVYLQSKGGKAITSSEDRIILGKIAANPNNATPQELKRAMQIINRNAAGNARQSMASLPAQVRSDIYNHAGGDSPGELESWANQSQTTPSGGHPDKPAPRAKKKYRMPDGSYQEASDE